MRIQKPPIDKFSEQLTALIDILTCFPIESLNLTRELKLGEMQYIDTAFDFQKAALHWMAKLTWHSKHKIPGKKSFTDLARPRGEVLKRIFLMCEKIHAQQSMIAEDFSYKDALRWFATICFDFNRQILTETVPLDAIDPSFAQISVIAQDNPENPENNSHKNNSSKDSYIDLRLADIRSLKGTEPTNSFADKSNFSHLSELVEAAIKMANLSDTFRDNHYKYFIDALRKETLSLEKSDFKHHYIKDGNLVYQAGRGRDIRNLTPSVTRTHNGLRIPSPTKDYRS